MRAALLGDSLFSLSGEEPIKKLAAAFEPVALTDLDGQPVRACCIERTVWTLYSTQVTHIFEAGQLASALYFIGRGQARHPFDMSFLSLRTCRLSSLARGPSRRWEPCTPHKVCWALNSMHKVSIFAESTSKLHLQTRDEHEHEREEDEDSDQDDEEVLGKLFQDSFLGEISDSTYSLSARLATDTESTIIFKVHVAVPLITDCSPVPRSLDQSWKRCSASSRRAPTCSVSAAEQNCCSPAERAAEFCARLRSYKDYRQHSDRQHASLIKAQWAEERRMCAFHCLSCARHISLCVAVTLLAFHSVL